MSNTANGILGAAPHLTSAKNKAGHAKTAETAPKSGDFASTVANLAGRGGEGGRKGANLSIPASVTAARSISAEQTGDTRIRTSNSSLPAIAEVLRRAGAEKAADKAAATSDELAGLKAEPGETVRGNAAPGEKAAAETGGKTTGGKADADSGTKTAAQASARPDADPIAKTDKAFDEKPVAFHDLADKPGEKSRTETQGKTKAESTDLKSDKVPDADAEAGAVPDTGSTADVGNLLALLTAPNAVAQVVANGQAAAAGGQNGDEQPDGEVKGRIDAHGDASSALADGAHADAAAVETAAAKSESDTDQLFRLIRADGKGRDVDMSISADGERTAVRDANPTGAKGETVTVVDARRYIGLASTGNSAAVTTALTQDPSWAASLSSTGSLLQPHEAMTGKVVNTLKIQMHPIELGLVTATLRLHGDELTVSLQVQTAEAYRQLSDDQDAMVKALRDQGFAVDQVSVQFTPADRNSGTQQGDGQSQQQQQQPQFSSQPQAREGGNGRQGAEGQAARSFAREEASHEGTTSDNAAGLAGGQSLRSGGVYL
ncbi:flagellar hook-length control protein FliK [Sinorhizobium sp. RAC02]|uniref:flagellar hook-length control protein FliK n=1 Tax=Sinorhizobium sp. RAC02 TaxID=1842534 RepID=UPI00083CD2A4|nr:flagellar hook-length control protein FliK [Sinorhizobium sp. RAC02]AOF91783.1 flagellar hook-length control FliK family protein [Sinorhizobium sp. RAC02]